MYSELSTGRRAVTCRSQYRSDTLRSVSLTYLKKTKTRPPCLLSHPEIGTRYLNVLTMSCNPHRSRISHQSISVTTTSLPSPRPPRHAAVPLACVTLLAPVRKKQVSTRSIYLYDSPITALRRSIFVSQFYAACYIIASATNRLGLPNRS